MKLVSKIKENLFSIFQVALIVLLIVAFVTFVGVLFFDYVKNCVSGLIGLTAKNKILTFLGIGMGGILVALQALMSYRRAKAMEETAKSQAKATKEQARANENTERGQRQERLKNAVEHLGHEKNSVRLGGAYELFHLVEKDSKDLRKTAFDILCVHIRQTTGEKEYQEKHNSKPSEEIQSLLTLLFVQDHEVFKGLQINLQGRWLKGADLRRARLKGAILNKAYLQGADLVLTHLEGAMLVEAHLEEAILVGARLEKARLEQACLQGADLQQAYLQGANLQQAYLQKDSHSFRDSANLERAHLQGAKLGRARLEGAKLRGAHLEGAKLHYARLQGAILWEAHLQGAIFGNAYLQGADLSGAYLQGANLRNAQLQGAILGNAQLQGANLEQACLQGADLEEACLQGAGKVKWSSDMSFGDRIQTQIGKESDLSGVTFNGGLNKESIKDIVGVFSDEKAKEMREKLEPHIGSQEITERSKEGILFFHKESDPITGIYWKREAEQWIAENKVAMSEFPEDYS